MALLCSYVRFALGGAMAGAQYTLVGLDVGARYGLAEYSSDSRFQATIALSCALDRDHPDAGSSTSTV
ncbi:MAG: hypothetical protein KC766_02985 [Myxococcales bacterium]|nr:hypothetical protein [Myxococcales bacterium]